MNLATTPDVAAPRVRDAAALERWLAQAPLSAPRDACAAFLGLLEDWECGPLLPAAAAMLARLREPLIVAQEELVKRFAGRALPLGDGEAAHFALIADVWSVYGFAYQRLVQHAAAAPGGSAASELPLLIGRAIEALTGLMLAHYRARREIDTEVWGRLHDLYALAESRGIAHTPIIAGAPDSIHCEELYVRALLLFVATPYGFSPKELDWVQRWTWAWAYGAKITPARGAKGFFGVDLLLAAAPRWMTGVQGPQCRRLDLAEVRRSVRKRMNGIEQGLAPAELGLGADVDPEEAWPVLAQLQTRWFETQVPRESRRYAASGRLDVAIGFEQIYNALAGPRPLGPKRFWHYAKRTHDELYTFGTTFIEPEAPARPPVLERWEQLDFSAMGFRLQRRRPGQRVNHRALLAVRAPDATAYMLCYVRWIQEGHDTSLMAGLHAFPGLAMPAAFRPVTLEGELRVPFHEAFILPLTKSDQPSLVLPARAHQPARVIDLQYRDAFYRVRLNDLLERGLDFDRCEFTVLPADEQPVMYEGN